MDPYFSKHLIDMENYLSGFNRNINGVINASACVAEKVVLHPISNIITDSLVKCFHFVFWCYSLWIRDKINNLKPFFTLFTRRFKSARTGTIKPEKQKSEKKPRSALLYLRPRYDFICI